MSQSVATPSGAGQAQPIADTRAPRLSLSDLGWLPIWIFTRIYILAQHMTRERHIVGDVNYYFFETSQALSGQQALVEYPAPVAWLLTALRLLSGDDVDRYRVLFVCLMAALDLCVSAILWTRYSRIASTYWMVFLMLVGSLMWYRIDLLAAVPMLLALLWCGPTAWRRGWIDDVTVQRPGHPNLAGGAVAVGAAMKLWPALLIFPLLGTSKQGKSRGLGFLIAGGVLGLSSLLFAGWTRSISPMTWQSDRGLHCESIWATLPMWRRTYGPDAQSYRVEFSNFNAYEIYGPGIDQLTKIADRSMIIVLALALLFGWLIALGGAGLPAHRLEHAAQKDGRATHWHAAVYAVVALMLATLVANKTFSPQYLIWFAGPLAVLVTLRGSTAQRAAQIVIAGLGLVIAGLTRWIYPLNYGQVIGTPDDQGTKILVLRNALVIIALLISLGLALVTAWRVGLAPSAGDEAEMPFTHSSGTLSVDSEESDVILISSEESSAPPSLEPSSRLSTESGFATSSSISPQAAAQRAESSASQQKPKSRPAPSRRA